MRRHHYNPNHPRSDEEVIAIGISVYAITAVVGWWIAGAGGSIVTVAALTLVLCLF